MATATKKYTSVEYTLKLNDDEARTLVAILALVGGSSSQTPRAHSDSILSALQNQGVEPIVYRTRSNKDEIFFE